MPTLLGRVKSLYDDLGRFPEGAHAEQPVVGVYNALLVLTQRERQDDAVLGTLSELSAPVDAASLRVLTGQLVAAFVAR